MPRAGHLKHISASPRGVSIFLAALAIPSLVHAQGADDGPLFQFGLSTGAIVSSNRGLDENSAGTTTELTSRLDFRFRFATPIQELELSGNIGLRSVNGAEGDNLQGGLFDPNLALGYSRQSRDAKLDVDVFVSERDVSSSELQFIEESADFDLLADTGTQRRFGFDTSLELRRRSPFGITLSAGFTGLRYSETVDPDLTDQDRFRLGTRFRFDINPATRVFVDARLSTFEDFGEPDEGQRETYSLSASLRHDLRNGNAVFTAQATDTEDGTRYVLTAGRTIETELWELTGALGLTRGVNGDVVPTGQLDLSHALPNGRLSANLTRIVRSGNDDDEQEITTLRLGYARELTALTTLDTSFSYTDRSSTGVGDSGTFATLNVGLQRALTADWRMDVGLQHRFREDETGSTARDNQLSINFRRSLAVRR